MWKQWRSPLLAGAVSILVWAVLMSMGAAPVGTEKVPEVTESPAVVPAPVNLESFLLEPNEDWKKYYQTTPAGTVKLYYTLAVMLDSSRRQARTVSDLGARVQAMEAQLAGAGVIDAQDQPIDGSPKE